LPQEKAGRKKPERGGELEILKKCWKRLTARTPSATANQPFDLARLEMLAVALDGDISRDRALMLCGHVFGPAYCADLLDWFFADGAFEKAALSNHVDCHIGAAESGTVSGQ
jgi:hypothetical protein